MRLDRPENPWDVLNACLHAGLLEHPQVVLAGFEAYNASAGRVRELLAGPDAGPGFIPPDKYAQRMALRKAAAFSATGVSLLCLTAQHWRCAGCAALSLRD